jgi:retron-type reverse transcriptase
LKKLEEIKTAKIEYKVDKKRTMKIMKNLANNKAMGAAGVVNEHYKYGPDHVLNEIVAGIFQLMINYQYMPYFFNVGIVKPIIKDASQSCSAINTMRPLTISDTLANIYEKYMLVEVEVEFENHCVQFGFKKHSSCQHAKFTLREVIFEYKSKGKMLLLSSLDFCKAFDKTNREYLFAKMRKGELNMLIWASLYKYYERSCAYVSNKGENSVLFKTTKGVKQGGPMSPKLYAIYVDDMLKELQESENGCKLGTKTINAIMYADDTAILAPTIQILHKLLKIVQIYCYEHQIKFNISKSNYMTLGNYFQRKIDKTVYITGAEYCFAFFLNSYNFDMDYQF